MTEKLRLAAITVAGWVCGTLDSMPLYADGRWYRHGQLGCRLGILQRAWSRLQPEH